MKNTVLFTALITVLFTSCTVVTKTTTAKTTDIYGAGVIHKPVLVDLEVKEAKVTGTATNAGNMSKTSDQLKIDAINNAIKNANADVLVEPKFDIEMKGSIITVVVTGYAATYKNFRSISAADVPLLQVGVTQKATVYEQPQAAQGSKKGGCSGK